MKNQIFTSALEKGHIEPAVLPDGKPFERDGVVFYWATERGINLYAGRFHAISDTLRSHDALKISSEMLDTSLLSIDDLCALALQKMNNDPRSALDAIVEVKLIASRVRERRTFGLNLEQIFDLAAVWFMTEDENPTGYDDTHGDYKRKIFRKYPELYDFFLQMPFNRFVPLSALFDPNIVSYMSNQLLLERMDLMRLSLKYGTDGLKPSTISTIMSRQETLADLTGLLDSRSNPTTTTSPPGSVPDSQPSLSPNLQPETASESAN